MRQIDYFLGLGSRYSYLASSQIDRIGSERSCVFSWKPIDSMALMDRRGANPFRGAALSGQYGSSYRSQDAKRWAGYYGIPYQDPKGLPKDPSLMSQWAYAAGEQGKLVEFCRAVLSAVFVEGIVIDAPALSRLAMKLELSDSKLKEAVESGRAALHHEAVVDEAISAGVFGVPTFVVDGTTFWGNDRLVLLEQFLDKR